MKNSILDISVSCFANCKSTDPVEVNLLSWLTSEKHANTVENLRSLQDENLRKIIKRSLPAITPSGRFISRIKEGLIEHTGLLAFDIDYQDNKHITNYSVLKDQIAHIDCIAYCGLSVSGNGYWGLVPIPKCSPEEHKRRFEALVKDFSEFNIILDRNCSDITRMRTYSHDPDPYFNHNAKDYLKINPKAEIPKNTYPLPAASDTRSKVESIIDQLKRSQIDITNHYKEEWFKIAAAFANEFGESGRGYFHVVSQYNGKYHSQDADKQYDRCLNHKYSEISIGSFFKIASDYGVTVNNILSDNNKTYQASGSPYNMNKTEEPSKLIQEVATRQKINIQKKHEKMYWIDYSNLEHRFPIFKN